MSWGYVAQVKARTGVLLGGVKLHSSAPFARRADAASWAATVVDTNKAAGRDAVLWGIWRESVKAGQVIPKLSNPRPGQKGFVRQLARSLAHRKVRSRATGRRRKIQDPLAYAATVERRRLGNAPLSESRTLRGVRQQLTGLQMQLGVLEGQAMRGVHANPGRRTRNPALAVFGNPARARRGERVIARNARLVEYTDPSKGSSTWFHKFDSKGVRILGEPDGSVRLAHPRRRLWSPDGRGQSWLENPGGARGGTMAKRRKHRRRHNRRRGSMRLYRRNDPGPRRRRRRRNDPGLFRRTRRRHGRRRNPPAGIKAFLGEIPRAAVAGLGITAGKAASRGLPGLVGFKPTGFMGLLIQLLTGTVAAGTVHLVGFRGFAFNMLGGTFSNVYESLARTGVAGKPIPFIGTALSDYTEAWRLAGVPVNRPPARGILSAYARPTMVRGRAMGRYQGNASARVQQQQGA